ncbi:hypothetical protein CKO28_01520 [Rhodovibrio sodomensis]|uniref:Uncharacterized protein n=1 Tax=Rhodovibrio sodomensis TaxID=1088 RepID=A0ABS1D9M2_9PROT|nr:hypothetical protein [Rhodovibrio sodomensis]MBK1666724.1 hypothetical protein [Rhodovibrio sodomensis]
MFRLLRRAAALLLLIATPAAAEPINISQTHWSFQPYTTRGQETMCALIYKAIGFSVSGQKIFIEGSLNEAYPVGKMPGVIFKLYAAEMASDGGTLRLEHAFLRTGELTTRNFQQLQSDTPGSYLAFLSMLEDPRASQDLVDAVIQRGAQVSFTVAGKVTDYTFRLAPIEAPNDAVYRFLRCNMRAMDRVRRELDAQ